MKNSEKLDNIDKPFGFEPSRHLVDFHIAGFTYYDGLEVIDELKLGTEVDLVSEPNNPADPNAIAIYYKNYKLGYVPNYKNEMLSTILYFGYADILEAKIQMFKLDSHPERQFRVVVKVKDNRKK